MRDDAGVQLQAAVCSAAAAAAASPGPAAAAAASPGPAAAAVSRRHMSRHMWPITADLPSVAINHFPRYRRYASFNITVVENNNLD